MTLVKALVVGLGGFVVTALGATFLNLPENMVLPVASIAAVVCFVWKLGS